MTSFSPKIEIINHFDDLINKVDIDIELCLEKCNDKKVLGELLKSSADDRNHFRNDKDRFYVILDNEIDSSTNNIWPESTKVIDYLNQVRMRTIEELKKAQVDYLEYYKLNSSHIKSQLTDKNSIDEFKSQLFADKFHFQVNLTQTEKRLWYFNRFTFVTDFYMSQSDIDTLEKLINAEEPFCKKPRPVFDQKMVLIGLLYKSFIRNLWDFPSHVIQVRKQDALNIKRINFEYEYSGINLTNSMSIDLSKLIRLDLVERKDVEVRTDETAEIKIEDLSSLNAVCIAIHTLEIGYFSMRNLPSLIFFDLSIPRIDENNTSHLFDQLQRIEYLTLTGDLYYFNLDSLLSLKAFFLIGQLCDGFNFELVKRLCNQIIHISIIIDKTDYEFIVKLFNCHKFPHIESLDIRNCDIRRLEKKFIEKFPRLELFRMSNCNLNTIEDGVFSNSNLIYLDLRQNLFKTLYKKDFSKLNLEEFNMSKNKLESIEDGIFSDMNNLLKINLSDNQLVIPSLKFDCADTVKINIENNRLKKD